MGRPGTFLSLIGATVACIATVSSQDPEWKSKVGTVALTLISTFFVLVVSPCFEKTRLDGRQNVLDVMTTQGARTPQPETTSPLAVFDMQVPFRGRWRLVPTFLSALAVLLPLALWFCDCIFSVFLVLTIYGYYNAWKMGLHIAIYTVVGCKRVALYQRTDFKALHYDQQQEERPIPSWPCWNDVIHFVVLPNYKEDSEVLRLAVESVARSSIAAQQICLVLAMEEREQGAAEKAEQLLNTFHGRFKHCIVTYHPPDVAGEMPGKSANTRWAANHIFDTFMPAHDVDPACAVITVADADSEFHSEYFSALTYHFLSGGCDEGGTPRRQLTIWQPPILHFKNYLNQPAIVRWCSFITSLHELSCLADPTATRIPYSTYSIPATLAMAVGGWDPDWISEDWHMSLKCFLATGGRLQILPIFLPILNYAPEGESVSETHCARWAQAKRHALGFAELVYFLDHFMRILNCIGKGRDQLTFIWKSYFLWGNCLMTHLVMASFWFLAPFNAMLIVWFYKAERQDHILEVSVFVANCLSQAVIGISFVGVCVASSILYDCVKDRVRGAEDAALSLRWRSKCVNSVVTTLETAIWMPLFFSIAGIVEWIAALRSASTHRFDYEVALKPNLSKEASESKSESTGSSTASGTDSASEPDETSELEDSSAEQELWCAGVQL